MIRLGITGGRLVIPAAVPRGTDPHDGLTCQTWDMTGRQVIRLWGLARASSAGGPAPCVGMWVPVAADYRGPT